MVGGGALLCALASGTGTAGLVLLLARRPGASAAAFGVTGAYAGAGALMAREGLTRLRDVGPDLPDVAVEEESVQKVEKDPDAPKRKSTAKTQRAKQSTKPAAGSTSRAKKATKSAASRSRASSA